MTPPDFCHHLAAAPIAHLRHKHSQIKFIHAATPPLTTMQGT
jgi:hypothetical protein